MEKLFYTVKEAAEFLRLAPSTIYALVHQRRITFRKHGRRVVFLRKNLEEFSRSNENKALYS